MNVLSTEQTCALNEIVVQIQGKKPYSQCYTSFVVIQWFETCLKEGSLEAASLVYSIQERELKFAHCCKNKYREKIFVPIFGDFEQQNP